MRVQRSKECVAEAIVLRSKTIGENDLWVDLLTPDHGRLRGIARHGRKSRKRFGTVLEMTNRVGIRYRPSVSDAEGLVALNEAVLLTPIHHLETEGRRLMAAFYLVDLIRQFLPERNPDPKPYALLKESLEALDRDRQRPVSDVVIHFEYRLLELSGYTPHLKQCLSCGKLRSRVEKFYFVYREGGIFCAGCLPGGTSSDVLSRDSLGSILARFIEYQLGRPLKSRKFLTGDLFCG